MCLLFMCLINIYFIKQLKENSFDKLFEKFKILIYKLYNI